MWAEDDDDDDYELLAIERPRDLEEEEQENAPPFVPIKSWGFLNRDSVPDESYKRRTREAGDRDEMIRM